MVEDGADDPGLGPWAVMERNLGPRIPLLLAWPVVAMACDGSADIGLPDGVPFLEHDSAGVLLATTLGARARAPIGWVVDTVPEYQVGAVVEGKEEHFFSRIGGAQQLPNGRVVVLDQASCEIRFFGLDGEFLELTGGRGEGPGELSPRCGLVASPGSERLVAFDGFRLSFFDYQGRFRHRLPVSWPAQPVTHVVGVAEGKVLVESRLLTVSRTRGLARQPSTTDFALLELENQRVVWEGFFLGRQHYAVRLPDSPYGQMQYAIPFDIRPEATLGMEGFYLTLGEDHGPEILEYDSSGGLRRIIRLAERVSSPSEEDLDKYTEFQIDSRNVPEDHRESSFDRDRPRYGEMPLPRVIPVFSRLLVDESGSLWARLYRFDVSAPVRWLVFAPNGEGQGSVEMPKDLEVWQIGRDFVLGVWRDEHDVEYVRRHALGGRR